jgi:iron complex outermembrane receptor protein
VNLNGVQGALRRDEDDEVSSAGLYVQGDWRFAERWSVNGGVRTSRVKVTFDDHFIVPGNGSDSGEVRFSATTPVIGVLYRAMPGLNLYASYGRGFETPTLAELAYRPGRTRAELRPQAGAQQATRDRRQGDRRSAGRGSTSRCSRSRRRTRSWSIAQ